MNAWLDVPLAYARVRNGSPSWEFFAIGGAVLLIIIVLGIYSSVQDKKRRAKIADRLRNRGFDVGDGRAEFGTLGPIEKLASREEKTVWSATGTFDDIEMTALEHEYSTGAGKSRQTHRHAVVSIALPTDWPQLQAYAENFFHRIGEMLGSKDFKLENEEFDRRFRIHTTDENFALVLLSPAVQNVMMTWDRGATLAIEGRRLCLVWTKYFNDEQWLSLLKLAAEFRKAIPPELDAWGAA